MEAKRVVSARHAGPSSLAGPTIFTKPDVDACTAFNLIGADHCGLVSKRAAMERVVRSQEID